MFSWFKRRKKARAAAAPRDFILNEGLRLAMEWGEDWLKPIQERLARRHPGLSAGELDEINSTCQAAMRLGHETVYRLYPESANNPRQKDFDPAMRTRYPWINADNLARLFSQGRYYAWKDFGE